MATDTSTALVWLASLQLAGAALFALAALLDLGLRRRSAALRRELWALAFAVALVLPLARLALPAPSPTLSPVLAAALLALWAAGAALLLARLVRAHARARRLLARSAPLTDPAWQRELDGHPQVALRLSDETDTPCTVGALRPAVLVPRRMLDLPAPERRALLAHELAHVARADCLLLLAGAVVRALYWISPLPWWALRRLRSHAEDAADDAVLRAGIPSSSYAAQLLALARASRPRVRSGGLRRRILAILDARRIRSREPRWSVPHLASAAALIAALATACEARSDPPASPAAATHE